MSTLINKCLLLFLSLAALIQGPLDTTAVTALLSAVILSGFASYFEGNLRLIFIALHVTAALFWPPLLFFLPLAAYDCFTQKELWCRMLWILPLLRSIPSLTPAEFFSCILLCLLAALLSLRTIKYDALLKEYHQVRDDTTETALALQEKNKELIKNQDYEVELATLQERNRIAREIHDNVGHLLTRSLLQVSALLVVHSQESQLKEELQSVKDTLSDAMDNVRSSVHNLHEDAVDLRQQLLLLTESFTFCPVKLTFDCGPLPREVSYAIIAIAKESLSNIARHSNATEGHISVLEHPSLYQVIIRDNGTPATSTANNGLGLFSMEERIHALNGIFTVTRSKGYRIFISIPKKQPFKEVSP